MEYESKISVGKNLFAILENNSIRVWDIERSKYTDDSFLFSEVKIQKIEFTKYQEQDLIIASDNQGNINVISVSTNTKENPLKILKDSDIIDFKISKTKPIVYCLCSGKERQIVIYDFSLKELKNCIKISKNKAGSLNTLAIDSKDNNLIFGLDNEINSISLNSQANSQDKKNVMNVLGSHSNIITFLEISTNNKLVVSGCYNDNYITIWDIKGNNNDTPLLKLLTNSVTCRASLHFVEKGLYHCFSANKKSIFCYKLVLSQLDSSKPVKPNFTISFSDNNLLNYEKKDGESLMIMYGNPYTLTCKSITYAKKNKEFKEGDILVQKNLKTNDLELLKKMNEHNMKVIGDAEMHEYNSNVEVNSEFKTLFSKIRESQSMEQESHTKKKKENGLTTSDSKIGLANYIRNSVINNDNKAFEWVLNQKDINIVENTLRAMEGKDLEAFLVKIVETFESSTMFKKNLVMWLDSLLKLHFISILQLPTDTLNKLKKLQNLIKNRTKSITKVLEAKSKLENLMNLFGIRSESQSNITNITSNKLSIQAPSKEKKYTAANVYNESDSDEEANKKLASKMIKNNVKATTQKKFDKEKKAKVEKATASISFDKKLLREKEMHFVDHDVEFQDEEEDGNLYEDDAEDDLEDEEFEDDGMDIDLKDNESD